MVSYSSQEYETLIIPSGTRSIRPPEGGRYPATSEGVGIRAIHIDGRSDAPDCLLQYTILIYFNVINLIISITHLYKII